MWFHFLTWFFQLFSVSVFVWCTLPIIRNLFEKIELFIPLFPPYIFLIVYPCSSIFLPLRVSNDVLLDAGHLILLGHSM